MSEPKTYVFGNDSMAGSNLLALLTPMMQNRGLDPNLVMSMMNNRGNCGYGCEGMWFMWIWFVMLLWGNNGYGGFGGRNGEGTGYLANMMNNDAGRELLSQAISSNGQAISQLAATLNCDINSVKGVLNQMQTQLCQVGNQIGMSGADVKNAIIQGNMSIAQQLASCCCDVRESITKSNYDNQIATLNQTNQITSQLNSINVGQERGFSQLGFETAQQTCSIKESINQGVQRIVDGQTAAQFREMQAVMNKQNDELTSYRTASIIAQQNAPINAALVALQKEVNEIKCAQPATVTVPNPSTVAVPACLAYQYGLNGFGAGFYNCGYWS